MEVNESNPLYMTYSLKLEYKSNFEEFANTWFHKSMKPLMSERKYNHFELHKVWEKTYNARLIYDSDEFVRYAEFPTEEDAIMFLLRWS